MKTSNSTQVTISHNLKDPHSKTLEPDCLSLFAYPTTQSRGVEKMPTTAMSMESPLEA
jgi:hypothetical protein